MEKTRNDQPRRRGRPKGQVLTEEVRIRLEPDTLDAIDARMREMEVSTRSAFIRRAIDRMLAAGR